MFKTHPKKSEIKFLVVPLLHEILETADDIHSDALELMQKYKDPDLCHGLNFDFSLLSKNAPNLWCISTFTNEQKVEEFYSKIKDLGGEPSYANVQQVLLEMVIAKIPDDHLEPVDEMYDRCQKIKTFLNEFTKTNCPGGEKIAVVCHYWVVASVTAKEVQGKGKDAKLIDAHWAENAEVIPMSRENLEL